MLEPWRPGKEVIDCKRLTPQDVVRASRGSKLQLQDAQAEEELFSGRVWTGRQARNPNPEDPCPASITPHDSTGVAHS